MENLYIFIGIGVLFLISLYIIYNLNRKVRVAEYVLASYWNHLDKLSKVIELATEKLDQVDKSGAFKSDDEIGFIFEEIKQLQEILEDFNIKESKFNG